MANPDYRAYTVIKKEGKEDFWLNCGSAFAHSDGDGYNIVLQAMPLDGKIVLRRYKEKDEQAPDTSRAADKGKPYPKK